MFSSHEKLFTISHQMFRHMYGVLNIDKKKLITQIACKMRDESLKPNWAMI